jgi:hypothetical protein
VMERSAPAGEPQAAARLPVMSASSLSTCRGHGRVLPSTVVQEL